MSIEQWLNDAGATDVWRFEGTGPGTVIGSPSFIDGVGGGLAASTDGDDGFVVDPVLPSDSGTFSVAVWVLPTTGAASGDILRWGSTPGIGIEWNGPGGSRQPGTATLWVRVSNGSYALRVTTPEVLAPDRWHLLVITVETVNFRGGVEAWAYLDGTRIGSGQYLGGLFNWINMDRPATLTILAGGAAAAVDEMGLLMWALTDRDAAALAAAGPQDTTVARYGWGVVF